MIHFSKITFTILISFLLAFNSCAPTPQEDATSVCDCWDGVFKISRIDEDKRLRAIDSCQSMYIDVLQKLENNPEQKAVFSEAYDYCREQN